MTPSDFMGPAENLTTMSALIDECASALCKHCLTTATFCTTQQITLDQLCKEHCVAALSPDRTVHCAFSWSLTLFIMSAVKHSCSLLICLKCMGSFSSHLLASRNEGNS